MFGCKQEAGTLVVCFPNAYTCSVNLGLNVSETMPMVLPEWLRMSSQASSLYRNHRVAPRFSIEKMILNAIGGGNVKNLGPETRYWLHRELRRLVEEETLMRYKLWGEGLRQYRRIIDGEDPRKGVGQHRDQQACISCGTPLVYSMVECACTPKVAACLHHRRHLCRCRADRQRLAWRYSVGELESHVEELRDSLDAQVVAYIDRKEEELAEDVQLCVEEAAVAAKMSEEVLREHVIEIYSERKGDRGKERRVNGGGKQEELMEELKIVNDLTPANRRPNTVSPSLTLVAECGYVQGPVRPFEHLDLPPEDFKSLDTLKLELTACCRKWIRDATATLEQGGNLVYELRGLIEEADEYLWATLPEDMRRQVLDLVPKLVLANKYVTSVERALNISNRKTLLEDVEKILNRDPMPIENVPGIKDLEVAVEQGKEWIREHYEMVSDMTCNPPLDIKVFDNVLFEAGKIPVALQEAKILRERRDAIKKVAEAVRFALPKGRESGRRKGSDEPVTLDYIESLQDEAKKVHIMMPEIEYLNETLRSMQDWRRRVEKALATRSAWKDYEELIEEGKNMPVEMPDIHRLYELRDAVSAWISGMRDLRMKNHDHKVPLKKLKDYLAEGYALPISFPEIQEMADYIQTFQLEDVAIKCISSSVREEDVREIMDAMAKTGVNNSATAELSTGLKAKLEAADAWRARAASFSSRSVAALEEIVREGEATGLKMALLDQLNERLAVVHRWIQRCNRCLSGVVEDPLRVPDISLQRSLIVECSLPIMRSRVRFIDTKEREKFPSSTVIAALIGEYDELGLDLPHYKELCVLHERAQAWLAEADPILNQTEMTEDQVPLVESLVEKGLTTGVKIAQVDNLESYMNAFLWMKTAQELLGIFEGGETATQSGVTKLGQEALAAFIAAGDVFASCKHTGVAKGLKKVANVTARWLKEAAAVLRTDKPKPILRSQVVELLNNGNNLPVDVDQTVKQVAAVVAEHDALVAELSDVWSMDEDFSFLSERGAALSRNPIESEAKTAVLNGLKEMEKTWAAPQPAYGTRFATQSTSEALATMLAMLSTAQQRADRVEKGTMSGDVNVCATGKADGMNGINGIDNQPVCVCQRPANDDKAGMVECDSCHALFHGACVNHGNKPSRGRKPKKNARGEQSAYMSKKQPPPPFVCPVCKAVAADTSTPTLSPPSDKERSIWDVLIAPLQFVFTTKEHLDALKEKVGGMRMFKQLASEVDSVLSAADAWNSRVGSILKQLETRSRASATSKASISDTNTLLHQLLLSSLAVGFDFSGLACDLIEHLRTNNWRAKALNLMSLDPDEIKSAKPVCTSDFLDQTARFLEEGITHGIDPSDVLYAGVMDVMAQIDAWRDKAKYITMHGNPVDSWVEPHTPDWHVLRAKAHRLIYDAEKLPWSIPDDDDQLVALKDHLAVYCLCQRPYDNAPMLACDCCANWFHFGCVGRREDPELEKEIENWNCPICFPHVGDCGAAKTTAATTKKRGRKKKKKTDEEAVEVAEAMEMVKAAGGAATASAGTYRGHMPIQGPAKETLSTIERVLPALSRGLGEPHLYKRILAMLSTAPFQRAVLGNRAIPDEALAGFDEQADILKRAMLVGAGGVSAGDDGIPDDIEID